MSRYSEFKNRIEKKRTEQEGATLLLALLFFLLCAVCGSVILASATASSGRIAGLSKNRQRYQSVEAAARLLENELNNASVILQETEKITVTVTHEETKGEDGESRRKTITTTEYEFTGPDFLTVSNKKSESKDKTDPAEGEEGTAEDSADAVVAFSESNGSNAQLSLLEQLLASNEINKEISNYHEKGTTYKSSPITISSEGDEDAGRDSNENLSACQSAWRIAFLTGKTDSYVERQFTLSLRDGDAVNEKIQADSKVDVKARLYGDGTLELRLCNAEEGEKSDSGANDEKAERYYMLLKGSAEEKSQTRTERSDADTSGDSDDDEDESSVTTVTKKTTLTWRDFTITKNAAEGSIEETQPENRPAESGSDGEEEP